MQNYKNFLIPPNIFCVSFLPRIQKKERTYSVVIQRICEISGENRKKLLFCMLAAKINVINVISHQSLSEFGFRRGKNEPVYNIIFNIILYTEENPRTFRVLNDEND